jgi:hypothetical protein
MTQKHEQGDKDKTEGNDEYVCEGRKQWLRLGGRAMCETAIEGGDKVKSATMWNRDT